MAERLTVHAVGWFEAPAIQHLIGDDEDDAEGLFAVILIGSQQAVAQAGGLLSEEVEVVKVEPAEQSPAPPERREVTEEQRWREAVEVLDLCAVLDFLGWLREHGYRVRQKNGVVQDVGTDRLLAEYAGVDVVVVQAALGVCR